MRNGSVGRPSVFGVPSASVPGLLVEGELAELPELGKLQLLILHLLGAWHRTSHFCGEQSVS